jgi:hypothetical protein
LPLASIHIFQLATETEIESLPSFAPRLLKAALEIVCVPLGTDVEFQLNVYGGDEVK